ncbi:MAG TPA: hypothetical protein ENG74_02000, partial [Thermoplasmatales archaeon]|nr:hypothetical protein [Thermoplasmatales archaeon]
MPIRLGNKSSKTLSKSDMIVAVSLASLVFITLFLAAYFNYTSGIAIDPDGETLPDKYYLSGPDPYYNMRIVEVQFETGHYPYWNKDLPDPLLNYPLEKRNSRPPLFNTLFTVFAKILSNFMDSKDAIGLSMQFLPSLYGALLVIPVYLIGALLFGRRAGLIGALLVPLIPIHLGAGHGAAYSLADHDSFVLLLGVTIYYFILKSLGEENFKRSLLYSGIAGVFLGMEALAWAGAYFFFAFLAFYFVIQMFVDIIRYKCSFQRYANFVTVLGVGLAVAFPSYVARGMLIDNMVIFSFLGVLLFGVVYLFLSKRKLPWLITIPSIFILALATFGALYLIKDTTNPALSPLARFANHIFGGLAYVQKSKVYKTIAEAATFGISRTFMSFGPALFLTAWAGFLYIIVWKRLIRKWDAASLFISVWFLVEVYLIGAAGRFINDLVPLVAILSGGIIWLVVSRIDYKQLIKGLRNVRGIRSLTKAVKISHVLGILIIAFVVIIPNAFLSFDAAVPFTEKRELFGPDYSGAFGLSLHTEKYWEDALSWLREENENVKDTSK